MKKDHWIIIVFLLTFVLSVLFSTVSNVIALSCNNVVLFIVLVLTISFGILFDLIGTAAITGNESTFHALNSKKIKGAKQGLALVKNSNKISSFCNEFLSKWVWTRIGEEQIVNIFIWMCILVLYIEVLRFSLAVMSCDKVFYLIRKVVLLGQFCTLCYMADNNLSTLYIS